MLTLVPPIASAQKSCARDGATVAASLMTGRRRPVFVTAVPLEDGLGLIARSSHAVGSQRRTSKYDRCRRSAVGVRVRL